MRWPSLLLSITLITAALGACDRAPPADKLPDWTAADHDRAEENARVKAGAQGTASPRGNGNPQQDQAQVIELTWKQNCTPCHGPMGHGDGPNGALVKAADLTNPDLQAKFSDADMATAIKNGKNLMPKFDFSDPVVAGLIARIRALKGQ
ncbi:MAG: cytochrome c [Polyangiaceae bacterium]